jgi:hypothetical protein
MAYDRRVRLRNGLRDWSEHPLKEKVRMGDGMSSGDRWRGINDGENGGPTFFGALFSGDSPEYHAGVQEGLLKKIAASANDQSQPNFFSTPQEIESRKIRQAAEAKNWSAIWNRTSLEEDIRAFVLIGEEYLKSEVYANRYVKPDVLHRFISSAVTGSRGTVFKRIVGAEVAKAQSGMPLLDTWEPVLGVSIAGLFILLGVLYALFDWTDSTFGFWTFEFTCLVPMTASVVTIKASKVKALKRCIARGRTYMAQHLIEPISPYR